MTDENNNKNDKNKNYTNRKVKINVKVTLGHLIAGRSQFMNWGGDNPSRETRDHWMTRLIPYIGKKVVLSGGGGLGMYLCRLDGIMVQEGGLQVSLSDLTPPLGFPPLHEFTPYIGSWAISSVKSMEGEK